MSNETRWCQAKHPSNGRQCVRMEGHEGEHATDGVPQAHWQEEAITLRAGMRIEFEQCQWTVIGVRPDCIELSGPIPLRGITTLRGPFRLLGPSNLPVLEVLEKSRG